MSLFALIFGKRPASQRVMIDDAPRALFGGAYAHALGPQDSDQPGLPRRARGRDLIIEDVGGDHRVVRGDIFDRTYEALGGGLYRKRDDVELRYFTLDRPAMAQTLEGEQRPSRGIGSRRALPASFGRRPVRRQSASTSPRDQPREGGAPSMFKLPPLPYPENALEPTISQATMATHYGKHHAAYIKNLNAALAEKRDTPAALEDVVRMASKEKGPLFNNAAQAWNHAFFWNALSPDVQQPGGALKAALDRDFKSFQSFHDEFVDTGLKQFGSGWAWLVSDAKGALSIKPTHDAGVPIVDSALTPLLVCDVWEHAYYLDYKNDRGAFLKAYVEKLANWRFAEAQYEAAKNGGKGAWVFPT